MASLDEQLHILRRGVEQIVPEDEFRKKLERSVRDGARRSASSTASTRPASTSTSATPSRCASSGSSRTWATRPSSSSATTPPWSATPPAATRPGPR